MEETIEGLEERLAELRAKESNGTIKKSKKKQKKDSTKINLMLAFMRNKSADKKNR